MNFLSNLYKPITEVINNHIVSGKIIIESDMLYYFVIDMHLKKVFHFIDTKKSFDEYGNMDLYNDGFFCCEDVITPFEEELLSNNHIEYNYIEEADINSRFLLVPYTVYDISKKDNIYKIDGSILGAIKALYDNKYNVTI